MAAFSLKVVVVVVQTSPQLNLIPGVQPVIMPSPCLFLSVVSCV